MDLGNKIKSYRVLKNLSPEQVAERLDISAKTYRKYESNENSPNLNMLERLAEILDQSVLDFLPESIVQNNTAQEGGVAFAVAYNPIINQLSENIQEYINLLKEENQRLKVDVEFWKNKSEGDK
jgi:transcriptional regulator with XRE-family HTH domain